MISITYLFHSGFALTTDCCILIFDYWMDPSGALPRIISANADKPVYVFASHFHEDHFTKEIFRWRSSRPNTTFTYILSKDILRHRRAAKQDADVWLAKGGSWEDANLKVTATGSNDSGVSWIVETDGRRIFHAGDLCNWYARYLVDNQESGEIYSPEFGRYVNPTAEEKRYLSELKDIKKICSSFDLVMFPVDGRIGNGYTLGARQFIALFSVGLFVPMHFVMSGFESARRMSPFCEEKNIPFWNILNDGDNISISDDIIIRHATTLDLPRLREIFTIARQFMVDTGNPNQWDNDYPSDALLKQDILNRDCYIVKHNNQTVATFTLHQGVDPTYNIIYEGHWLNNHPYATIHRIASTGALKGILHLATLFAFQLTDNIRIDTHRDNKVMQHALSKEGFKYCGLIRCWNGSERVAYQICVEDLSIRNLKTKL